MKWKQLGRISAIFGETQYLSPYGFYNSDRVDLTDKMRQSPRPEHMCFPETKFGLLLAKMGEPFTVTQRCDLTCFLHLWQSLDVNVVSSSTNPPQNIFRAHRIPKEKVYLESP